MFSDLIMARRLERAEGMANADFVEARARCFPDVGAAWMEAGGTFAMFDGVASPITQTFGLGLNGVDAGVLDEIESFFRERQSPICHEVSPLADEALWPMLKERRYEVIEFTNVMWRPLTAERRPRHGVRDSMTARPIHAHEHEVWAVAAARGWSHLPELTPFMQALAAVNPHRRHFAAFVAEAKGEVVAAGGINVCEGTALLGGASTVPEARNRGAQRALLEARLDHALAQGCDLAMMCAAPGSASQRNAERQGFRIAYTRVKWRQTRQT